MSKTRAISSAGLDLELRPVRAGEAERLRAVRLAALSADADSYRSSYEVDLDAPAKHWTDWAAASGLGTDQRTFVVVDQDERWLGLALVRRSTEQPEEAARVNAMWVAAEARGGGLGVALCEACAEWASARGFKRLILATYATNEPALRVYRTAGFAVSGPEEIGRTGRAYVNMVRPL